MVGKKQYDTNFLKENEKVNLRNVSKKASWEKKEKRKENRKCTRGFTRRDRIFTGGGLIM